MEVTMDYLFGKLTELAKKVDTFALCNLKKYLSLISVEKEEHCFDPILAAYLLNPLKNDYDFEDIAREQWVRHPPFGQRVRPPLIVANNN